jgi:hypothetical protein
MHLLALPCLSARNNPRITEQICIKFDAGGFSLNFVNTEYFSKLDKNNRQIYIKTNMHF